MPVSERKRERGILHHCVYPCVQGQVEMASAMDLDSVWNNVYFWGFVCKMSDWVGSLGKDKDCVEMGVDRDAVYLWDQENASVSYPVEISVHLRKPFLHG